LCGFPLALQSPHPSACPLDLLWLAPAFFARLENHTTTRAFNAVDVETFEHRSALRAGYFFHLLVKLLPFPFSPSAGGTAQKTTANMVEIKNHRVFLATLNTRMGEEIFPDHTTILFVVGFVIPLIRRAIPIGMPFSPLFPARHNLLTQLLRLMAPH
jgi:hypothetical protein